MTTLQRAGTLSVNGLPMYHEVHGAGPPLVLLHGALGSIATCFPRLLPKIAHTRQVIAVELQAHGHTPDSDRPLRFDTLADDIAALISHFDCGPVDLVGYSMGGGVALETARRHPNHVRRVVFAGGPAFRPDGFHPEMVAAPEGTGSGDPGPPSLEGTVWHQAYLEVAPHPENWATLVAKIAEDGPHVRRLEALRAPTHQRARHARDR